MRQITTWCHALIPARRLAWAVRIALANTILITGSALADDTRVCLDSTAVGNIIKEYKIRCQQNIDELDRFLRINNVTISETGEFTYNSELVECDFVKDPLLRKMTNSEAFSETEVYIATVGVARAIEEAQKSLLETRKKYLISYLEDMAENENFLKEYELKTLAAFAKTRAKSEAIISVVETCR